MTDKPNVWVGLRECGHAVSVVVEMTDNPRETERAKREFLRDGLSVIRATWGEWETKYLPMFMRCECGK